MKKVFTLLIVLNTVACTSTPSEDEQQILHLRSESNDAIARHDAAAVGQSYTDDFSLLSSSNTHVMGKEKMIEIFRNEFTSKKDVRYVRTPANIEVNQAWKMASEFGHWVGTWKTASSQIKISGNYYAKWHKIGEQWFIRSETYTPLHCTGDGYCDQAPF